MKSERVYLRILSPEAVSMVDDVLISKAESIERCLQRINEDYLGYEHELETNFTRRDAIILNLQRACETSIGAAMRIVRIKNLGVPEGSREAFELLARHNIIPASLSESLKKMVGFRNIAIHDYQKINTEILKSILDNNLGEFKVFAKALLMLKN